MIYELWDEKVAFLIDTYTTMQDALDVVAATYREHGESAEGWRLLRSTPSGESAVPIAHGVDLVYLARGELRDDYPLLALDRFVLGDDKPDSFIATGILAINHGGSIPAPLIPERIPGFRRSHTWRHRCYGDRKASMMAASYVEDDR